MEQYKPSDYFTPETLRRLGNLGKSIYNYGGYTGYKDYVNNMGNSSYDLNLLLRGIREAQGQDIPGVFTTYKLPTKSNPFYVNGHPVYFDGSYVPDLDKWYNLTGTYDRFGNPPHENYIQRGAMY